jgi:hypothetical protein
MNTIHIGVSKSYAPHGVNDNEDIDNNSVSITPQHAVAFIFCSSSFLVLMYFVNVYFIVRVLYLGSAGFASAKVFFYPVFKR